MYFLGKIIQVNGIDKTIGLDIDNWEGDILEPFKFSENIETGYTDLTTIPKIKEYGHLTIHDSKFVRDQIKTYVKNLGQSNLQSTPNNLPIDPSTLTPQLNQAWQIGEGAVGVWLGRDEQVAMWDGSDWVYFVGDPYADGVEEYGYTFLDATDKKTCSSKLIGTVAQSLGAYGINPYNPQSTQIQFLEKAKDQGQYRYDVQECRINRYQFIENDVLQNIPSLALEVLTELGDLPKYYKENGVDGYPIDEFVGDKNDPNDVIKNMGLASYLLGVGVFEGAGLINKTFITLSGQNPTDYTNYLVDKLFITGLITSDLEFINIS